jgi:hypothetical protein
MASCRLQFYLLLVPGYFSENGRCPEYLHLSFGNGLAGSSYSDRHYRVTDIQVAPRHTNILIAHTSGFLFRWLTLYDSLVVVRLSRSATVLPLINPAAFIFEKNGSEYPHAVPQISGNATHLCEAISLVRVSPILAA